MFRKGIGSPVTQLLKRVNLTKQTARYATEFSSLSSLLQSHNSQAPAPKHIIKALKNQNFTPCYLLKCVVTAHFFLQNVSQQSHQVLMQFTTFLMEKCNTMIEFMNNRTLTQPNESKTLATANSSERDESFRIGKTYFLLKQIVRPYLAYILKFAAFLNQDHALQPRQLQIFQIWRDINLLNCIHGFTNNFTIIGRYCLSQLGAFVVLISETLSIDINCSYQRIKGFIGYHSRFVCVQSDRKEEQREAREFCRLLEEIGCINEKFNQFYLGKYFYQYLQHVEQPTWIDINSKAFDRIFHGNKDNFESTRASSSHVFK